MNKKTENRQKNLTPNVEQGVDWVYPLILGYWIATSALAIFLAWILPRYFGFLSLEQFSTSLLIRGSTLVFLLSPWAQKRLGNYLLPLVITLCTATFLLEKYWVIAVAVIPGAEQMVFAKATIILHDYALLVLLVAWKYRFRYVILYILVFSGIEETMILITGFEPLLVTALPALFSRALIYIILGYIITRLRKRQREQHQKLILANQKQMELNSQLSKYASTVEQLSVSRERDRMARELHDTLAHSLSAVNIQLEAVVSLWDSNSPDARNMLEKAGITVRSGLVEARRALQGLRATPLEDSGLVPALRDLAGSTAERGDLQLILNLPKEGINLPPEIEQGIYRIAQEAFENVIRHAQAKQLRLDLSCETDTIRLVIEDDGIGMNLEKEKEFSEHLGIRGMQERIEILGGALQINSEPQKGTSLSLTMELTDESGGDLNKGADL